MLEGEGDNDDDKQEDNDGIVEHEQDDSSSSDGVVGQEAGIAAIVAPKEGNEGKGKLHHDSKRRSKRSKEDIGQQEDDPPVDQPVLGGTEALPAHAFEIMPLVRNGSRKMRRHQTSKPQE